MADEKNKKQINIELPESVAAGTYSNLALINHSNTEFILDFVQMMPGLPKAQVRSRIIMTPSNAKRLMKALAENINRYETLTGEAIKDISLKTETPPIIHGGPPPTDGK